MHTLIFFFPFFFHILFFSNHGREAQGITKGQNPRKLREAAAPRRALCGPESISLCACSHPSPDDKTRTCRASSQALSLPVAASPHLKPLHTLLLILTPFPFFPFPSYPSTHYFSSYPC